MVEVVAARGGGIGLCSAPPNEPAAAFVSLQFVASSWFSFQYCVQVVEAFASGLSHRCILQRIWQICKETLPDASPFEATSSANQ